MPGSGASNLNRHPNHPLRHAICVAAIVFDIVAKDLTMATNFLRLFKVGSARLALVVGASEVGCGASEGRIYTWSVEGATSSGTRIQFHGNWLKGKLLWFFPCFYSTALLSQQGNDFFFFFPWQKSNT